MPLPLLAIPFAAEIGTLVVGSLALGWGIRHVGDSVEDASKKASGALLIASGAAAITYYFLKKNSR
jgi:hypothetical protein